MRLCGERTGFINRMDYGGEGGKEEGRRERREEASLGALFVLVAPERERDREREREREEGGTRVFLQGPPRVQHFSVFGT